MNTSHAPLFAGLLIGFSVAVPIGPMGLLCIQRTLASGMRVGWFTGLGAATVNAFYGTIIIFGFGQLDPFMAQGGRVLSALGGLFLLWSAVRTFRRKRLPNRSPSPVVASPSAAYGSAVLFNLTNPLAPILMMALLAPLMSQGGLSSIGCVVLITGIFLAAASWWLCLSGGVSLLRSRLSPGVVMTINRFAGTMLTLYGTMALARSAGL
ncbi:MAG: hypothetical protein EOO40_06550 [Deltaproteobacteria bacterium]|nr:MAG: hypothetical protein EOO40_06550 [Deltaproteobacteria bacterium]